jgi:hypothetical protein
MRKEYDLRSLKVKRRGPLAGLSRKSVQVVSDEKPTKPPSTRPKRHR